MTIPATEQTSEKVDDLRALAAATLSDRLQHAEYFGFKDPSTIKVVPFWRSVFSDLKLDDYYLIALRNPLAAARSYQKLTGCDLELGLLLWCAHLLQAVEATHGLRRMVVSYDLLLQDPRRQLERISSGFHFGAMDEHEAQIYIDEFLDQKLNRFQASHDEFRSHESVRAINICKKIYDCLLRVACDELALESAEFTAVWQDIVDEYNQFHPMYRFLDQLLKQHRGLKRELRNIHRSWLWKLLSPFWRLDLWLRNKRINARLYKRLAKAYE